MVDIVVLVVACWFAVSFFVCTAWALWWWANDYENWSNKQKKARRPDPGEGEGTAGSIVDYQKT